MNTYAPNLAAQGALAATILWDQLNPIQRALIRLHGGKRP